MYFPCFTQCFGIKFELLLTLLKHLIACYLNSLFWSQILQTGQEIMELDTSGFATQGPTVFAGNIGENKYIIQVSPMGIRLLEGGNPAVKILLSTLCVFKDENHFLLICLQCHSCTLSLWTWALP